MGEIREKTKLCGVKKCIEVNALIDTGSNKVSIDPKLAEEIGVIKTGHKKHVTFPPGEVVEEVEIKSIKICGCKRVKPRLFIHPKLKESYGTDLTIGYNLMQDIGLKIDMETEKLKASCTRDINFEYVMSRANVNKAIEAIVKGREKKKGKK